METRLHRGFQTSISGQVPGSRRNIVTSAIKKKAPKQIAVSRSIASRPEVVDKTAGLCQKLYEHTLRVAADRDIQSFDFWKDPAEPVFHFYEVYESDSAFTEYYNSDEMRDFLEKVEPLAASEIGMTYVQALLLLNWMQLIFSPPCTPLTYSSRLYRSFCSLIDHLLAVCTRSRMENLGWPVSPLARRVRVVSRTRLVLVGQVGPDISRCVQLVFK